jgi:hypothetical protein
MSLAAQCSRQGQEVVVPDAILDKLTCPHGCMFVIARRRNFTDSEILASMDYTSIANQVWENLQDERRFTAKVVEHVALTRVMIMKDHQRSHAFHTNDTAKHRLRTQSSGPSFTLEDVNSVGTE